MMRNESRLSQKVQNQNQSICQLRFNETFKKVPDEIN